VEVCGEQQRRPGHRQQVRRHRLLFVLKRNPQQLRQTDGLRDHGTCNAEHPDRCAQHHAEREADGHFRCQYPCIGYERVRGWRCNKSGDGEHGRKGQQDHHPHLERNGLLTDTGHEKDDEAEPGNNHHDQRDPGGQRIGDRHAS
jgi:hypothetical protein